jgi:hypothetical protein
MEPSSVSITGQRNKQGAANLCHIAALKRCRICFVTGQPTPDTDAVTNNAKVNPAPFPFAAGRPNIVYILVDNWGWGDISVQGSTLQTPNIDQFASEGFRLTNFNVQNQCTPTRSALHTGRLPIRSGTQKVPAPGDHNQPSSPTV